MGNLKNISFVKKLLRVNIWTSSPGMLGYGKNVFRRIHPSPRANPMTESFSSYSAADVERLEETIAKYNQKVLKSKDTAREALIKEGFLTEDGKPAERYHPTPGD